MRRIFTKILLLSMAVCFSVITNAQVNYYSLSGSTDFSNPASWTTDATGVTSTAPPTALTNADNFTILAGHSLNLNADATVRQLTNNGTLTVSANTLYIERATGNQATFANAGASTLNISGGAIRVKGSVTIAGTCTFIQSGGDLYIDGNSGTTGTATNPSVPLLNITSSVAINVTGGSWTFPDPHGTTSTTAGAHECIYYNPSNSINGILPATHTINFGDGVSTSAGGSANGFRTNLWAGSGRLTLGSITMKGVSSATNRFTTHAWTPAMNGNLLVESGEARFTTLYCGGNITVNAGATLTVGTLFLAATTLSSSTGNAMVATPQSITNNGTIKSAATAVANLNIATLNIANNSSSGVTLNSPLHVGSLAWSIIGTAYQGYINTTTTNYLRIVGSGGTGVTATTLSTSTTSGATGDSDAFVRGPLQMTLGTGFSTSANIAGFPVGASTFAPFGFTAINGAPASATTIQVTVDDANAGVAGTGILSLQPRRWDVSVVGTNGLTARSMKPIIGHSTVTGSSLITFSLTPTGTYDITGGSAPVFAASTATYDANRLTAQNVVAAASLFGSYGYGESSAPPACAVLSSPANAANVYGNTTLSWTNGGGATSYDIYISSTSPAYDPLNPSTNLVTNVATLSYLYTVPSGGTFYWTVIAKNSNGSATGCTERSFVVAVPGCATLSSPAAAATNVYINPTLTWTAPSTTAASYDLYLSTTSPAYNAANPATNFVTNTTNLSYAITPDLLANTTYYWTVIAKNIAGSAVSCTERSFTTGTIYSMCTPTFNTFGCTDGDVVARVILNTLDNNSGTGCPGGVSGYSDYRSNPALTTTLNAGTTYNCIVYAGQYSGNYAAWIDFNGDRQFDVSERIGFTTTAVTGSGVAGTLGSSASFPLSIPCNPIPGTYTLRVREAFSVNGNAINPCGAGGTSNGYGEVEDYLITIAPPPPCPQPATLSSTATTTPWNSRNFDWVNGCVETQWEVLVQTAGAGTPSSGATPTHPNITAHPFSATGLTPNSNLEFWVRAVCGGTNGSSDWTGPHTFTTPIDPPTCATLNTPLDMATYVPLTTPLTWSAPTVGGAPASYKVFFGTSLPATPTATVANTVFTYSPATTYNTTYSWQIIPTNASGDATGCPIFTYTTDTLTRPACATMTFPANAATDIFRNPTLTWNAVAGADGYKVYLATTASPYSATAPTVNLLADVTVTSFQVNAPVLAAATTYYWVVVPYNIKGNAIACTDFTFTTGDVVSACTPTYTYGKTDGDLISNVQIVGTTLANNTGTAPTNPAYTFFAPSASPSYTCTLNAGTSYNVNVSVGTFGSQNMAVWIDYNDNGVFETTERVGNTTAAIGANGSATFSISLACNPPVGPHLMRVRDVYATTGSSIDPCINYGYGETEDYVVTVAPPPPCPQPSNLTSAKSTTTPWDSRRFDWTNGCTENQWDIFVQPAGAGAPNMSTTPTHPAVTAHPFTATGLTPSTNLEVWVRAVCGGTNGSSDWVGPVTFSTDCSPVTTFNESFDGVTAPALPTCWSKVGTTGSANTQTGSTMSAPNSVYLYSFSGAYGVMTMPPVSNASAGTHRLKFKARANFSVGGTVEVGYLTNPNDETTFVGLGSYVTTSTTVADNFILSPVVAPAGVYYLAMRASDSGTSVLVDDVVYDPIPTCLEPQNINITGVTNVSATLNWTASVSNPTGGYNWKVVAQGAGSAGTAVSSGNSTTLTANMTGLTASTPYEVWMQSDCQTTGGLGNWEGPVKFTTLCDPVATLPWTENFDALTTIGTTSFPICWNKENGDWQTANAATDTYTDPLSGPNYLREAWSAVDEFIWTPAFALTAGKNYKFSFQMMTDGFSGWTDIGVFANNTQSSVGATQVGALISGPTHTAYQLYEYTYTATSTGNVAFAIRVNANSTPWYLGFDDFKFEELPPVCVSAGFTPTNNATSVAVSGNLSWTAVSGATSYDVYLGTDSTLVYLEDVSRLIGNATSTSIAYSGLSNNTKYFWKAVAKNAAGSATGCSNIKFTTIAAPTGGVKLGGKVYLNHISGGVLSPYLPDLQGLTPASANFPLSDPYSAAPYSTNPRFTHVNNGPVQTTTTTVLSANDGTGNDIVDWVLLQLRTGVSGSTTVAYTQSALLQADGDIVKASDGVSPVEFPNAAPGSYYITVLHRNHLGFRTDATQSLSGTSVSLNFTNNSVALYGSNPTVTVGGVRTMVGGDANLDGAIDSNDKSLWNSTNGLSDDYQATSDFNLDGQVDSTDKSLWNTNNGLSEELD